MTRVRHFWLVDRLYRRALTKLLISVSQFLARFRRIQPESLNRLWRAKLRRVAYPPTYHKDFGPQRIKFLDSILPSTLKDASIPINVLIVTSAKGAFALELTLKGIRENLQDKLIRIYIVVPDSEVERFRKHNSADLTILSDTQIISKNTQRKIKSQVPDWRYGWTLQQVIKMGFLYSGIISDSEILILDSDTVLLRGNSWINNRKEQLISISEEYHYPYQFHLERFLSSQREDPSRFRLSYSFVTHHGVFQREILDRLLQIDNLEDFEDRVLIWIGKINLAEDNVSFCCEWHSYGTYGMVTRPELFRVSSWRNLGIPRSKLENLMGANIEEISIDQLRRRFPRCNSLSLHWYMDTQIQADIVLPS